ncbi:MAG TPA: cyclopropane-fatty-acyl-phospholipid synthase family protein [Alphaproteobacteria bacterium]|nr:cyclopropane-fatty-acyl-phospholipid synthase family protein [Alphaproteobacteria bacterium]
MLLIRLLRKLIHTGSLTLIDAKGRKHVICDEGDPRITVRIHDAATQWKLALNPALYVGEAYMDGRLTVEEGSIYDFLDVATRQLWLPGNESVVTALVTLRNLVRALQQINPVKRAKANVAHHYDLSDTLYDLFLDSDRQYSCAYFDRPNTSLEDAQEAKKRHIAAKLLLNRPNLTVLDIGCGWGGLALFLAAETGAKVTGITLSEEQLKVARARAERAGLSDRVSFHLRDYRDEDKRYDRVVSVGMFEHVGVPHYPVFFRKVHELLADDGVALLHSIGRADGPGSTNPWVRKYIFPGGYCPALSEVLPAAEKQLLYVTDIEILRLHYAKTLREWRHRFMENRDKVKALYDERFCRMWEFYLSGAEVAFRNEFQMVFQMQMTKDQEAVPLTRDYITDWERARNRKSAAAE